jgi:hypothetical protein
VTRPLVAGADAVARIAAATADLTLAGAAMADLKRRGGDRRPGAGARRG